MRPVIALIGLVLVATSCAGLAPGGGGSGSPRPTGDPLDLVGAWVLTRGDGPGGPIQVPDGWRVTLNFNDEDEFGGQACNHYGGTYDLGADGAVTFANMFMTEMACEEPMMTVESTYHAALMAVTRAARIGDELTMRGEGAELVYSLLPPVPDEALQGTRWMLESLILGDAVSSVQGDAWLILEPNGTITGSTGCRELSGRYVVSGDQLRWTDLRAEGACSADLEQQDRLVVGVLEQPIVTIEGSHLTLSRPDGTGLGYLAPDR
jgi:heat shock protein HslJ